MPATTLAELTTFRVGGPIGALVEAADEAGFIEAIRRADERGASLLVLGGGSNVLVSDAGFPGVVVRDRRSAIAVRSEGADARTAAGQAEGGPIRVEVSASAGAVWDDFVVWNLERGLSGLEALSGIPGTVGAAPVQNVGAYGHEVSDRLVSVRAWDRAEGAVVELSAADLALSYRDSLIKRSLREEGPAGRVWGPTGRWVVLEARFALEASAMSAPVLYRELANRLGVEVGERAEARRVRSAVLDLRRSKGMVVDPADHDTWSAGSFFTNPILPAEDAMGLPEGAPRFPLGDGRVKTSAAWLIDHAGFAKGFAVPGARAGGAALSSKHVLALTNRGDASAAEVVELALAVRAGVEERFGVRLVPEPVGVGVTW
ncbi:UDP-N-acetylmuramate dehydrogenase [Schaalia hyovaginalis]|uniref:UDP-N-acetylmuramate dehydrogenase n=1 Tax=Schaalia hyovaginalis TaxID=29316 RepID=UPI0026ECF6E8|nr:UDP-N-acetylmuramate dehydrogenase [Schaalia hyovaginalis]MCI7512980.1 UDP-N-acetylmuramate dehydrogenase [Schaalia hyovaginalis]